MGRKVGVPSDRREEGYLYFVNVIDHLPRKSAEPRFGAGFGPEASQSAEEEPLPDRASTAVVSHLAQLVLKILLALLS